MNAKDEYGQTALHWAIGLQSKDLVSVLLANGCAPTVRDRGGESALCRSIEFDDEEIAVFVTEIGTTSRERLIQACASCPVDALTAFDEKGEQLAP